MKLLAGMILVTSMALSQITLPKSFKANFTQKITNTKNSVIVYHGEVRFWNKKFFKWSYLNPTQKEVCSDGKELLVVDHDLEQVSIFYIRKGLDIAKVLAQAKHYKENIYLATYEDKKYTIQLNHAQVLQSIAYFDELDNKVQILFTQMKYPKGKFTAKEMQCGYPVEYDVIRG
ncbi:Outer membrane lipoprotein carrier protein LolA [hydrothermal vent metagenome]|uniref:Outer membrane lipoprotein carrier protein LolA n=1 Tax=hydrothermal vent metagenome TaxID=652676 RepID=A0A1W1BG88_9ZZZZ